MKEQHHNNERVILLHLIYMKKLLTCLLLNFLLITTVIAQADKVWNGKNCAVVLTYDDAINEHLDNAVPVLDSLGLKATFYVTGFSSYISDRMNHWKQS